MSRTSRILSALALAVAASAVGLHLAAIATENVNWDEFALLQRTANMIRTGAIQGGRPGAADQILAPLVRGCVDAVATVRAARWIWAGLTLAAIAGFVALLRVARDHRRRPWPGAVAGAALLALAPAFLRWSLHVRTDQGALAFGLWAGVALLASRRRAWLALVAGCGFGFGFLFTQKLVYVGLLVFVLMVGDFLRPGSESQLEARRFVIRAALTATGGALVLLAYRALLPQAASLRTVVPIEGGLRAFAHYRQVFGYVAYRGMLPTLVPQMALLALLVVASMRAVAAKVWSSPLTLAWTVLVAGASVGLFHAGAFPYFWMTLGLFPATAIAVAWEEIVEAPPERLRALVVSAAMALLVVSGLLYATRLLDDTQAVQRQVLGFVERNFDRAAPGFQLEGALFCRADPDPFPPLFRENIESRYQGPDAGQNIERLLARFRDKGVRFVIASHMTPFMPAPVRMFWRDHYVPYFGPVWVLGRALRGAAGESQSLDLIASAAYRWLEADDAQEPAIAIDGRPLGRGETVFLSAGRHEARFLRRTDSGALVLALNEPPRADATPFYSPGPIREITGEGYW